MTLVATAGLHSAELQGKRLLVRPARLEGKVQVSGAKNSALRLLAATLLTDAPVKLTNHPSGLLDAAIHIAMLESLGKICAVDGDTINIEEAHFPPGDLEWYGRSIRNNLLILGALTARTGAASVPLPGGCDIGDRKYDLHALVLEKLGAKVWEKDGRLHAEARHGLTGAEIVLPLRSTGATENALLCGSLARGQTVIRNPHIRPEILDLAHCLTDMGATITVNGQESIVVEGAAMLQGIEHRVMPDNMEAMTWLIAAVMTGGEIEIEDFPFDHLEVPLIFLRESGACFSRSGGSLLVRGGRPLPVEISTGPYPGINSDMQPLFAAYGACANGVSHIVDLRFPDRYAYLSEFSKFGIESEAQNGPARIYGGADLKGANVTALDLRAGAALLLLGMVASGETVIDEAWQIFRGYDRLLAKVNQLGGRISLV